LKTFGREVRFKLKRRLIIGGGDRKYIQMSDVRSFTPCFVVEEFGMIGRDLNGQELSTSDIVSL
jgi:hypothetical protein